MAHIGTLKEQNLSVQALFSWFSNCLVVEFWIYQYVASAMQEKFMTFPVLPM